MLGMTTGMGTEHDALHILADRHLSQQSQQNLQRPDGSKDAIAWPVFHAYALRA